MAVDAGFFDVDTGFFAVGAGFGAGELISPSDTFAALARLELVAVASPSAARFFPIDALSGVGGGGQGRQVGAVKPFAGDEPATPLRRAERRIPVPSYYAAPLSSSAPNLSFKNHSTVFRVFALSLYLHFLDRKQRGNVQQFR